MKGTLQLESHTVTTWVAHPQDWEAQTHSLQRSGPCCIVSCRHRCLSCCSVCNRSQGCCCRSCHRLELQPTQQFQAPGWSNSGAPIQKLTAEEHSLQLHHDASKVRGTCSCTRVCFSGFFAAVGKTVCSSLIPRHSQQSPTLFE